MKSIKHEIEMAYDAVSAENLVFTDKRRKKITNWSFVILIIVGLLAMLASWILFKVEYVVFVVFVIWMILFFLFIGKFVNQYAKKQLVSMGIKPTKGFF